MSDLRTSLDFSQVVSVRVEAIPNDDGAPWFKLYFYGAADSDGYRPSHTLNVFGVWSRDGGREAVAWDVSALVLDQGMVASEDAPDLCDLRRATFGGRQSAL